MLRSLAKDKRFILGLALSIPLALFFLALLFPPGADEKARRIKPCFKSIESNRIRFVNLRSIHYQTEALEGSNTLYRHRGFLDENSPIAPVLLHSALREEVYIRFESRVPGAVLECGELALQPDTGDARAHWKLAYLLLETLEQEQHELLVRTQSELRPQAVSAAERKAFVRCLEDYFRWTDLNECP
jgi:hypothetical protein